MTSNEWKKTASELSESMYSSFLTEVIDKHVVNDREERELGENLRKKVINGASVDPRALRLMTISGKGGYSPDPEKQKKYYTFQNVSLLDHLLSVTRGALVLSAFDYMSRNPEMDFAVLQRRLAAVAAIGFLHDTDKDLSLPRNTPLTVEHVAERMQRYGIHDFLTEFQAELTPSQVRYLIEKVESTQAHRHQPEVLPPREFERLPLYVRLADKLDGAWLSGDPETGGFAGVLKRLREDESCLKAEFLKVWKPVQMYDPHHPFLLDELQRWLSRYSLHITGVPPLVEVHQDGHLFMLLPGENYAEITQKALEALANHLPFNLELNVSNRGIPALYNGQPSHDRLETFVRNELTQKQRSDLFKVKGDLVAEVTEPLDDLLETIGLQPRWPQKSVGQLVTLYASFNDIDSADLEWFTRAAHLVLLLNLKVDAKSKDGIPDPAVREKHLLEILEDERPSWIAGIGDDLSRRTVTALWATVIAAEDDEVLETVWGEDQGLLKKWLEGNKETPGFNRFIKGEGAAILEGVIRRFHKLLNGERVTARDEKAKGRCLFTNEPVPFSRTIDQALGLYGVKVSAFSGRDNRPETITSERSHTNVGDASIAEHKVRAGVHQEQGGKEEGVPALVSSPTTVGLFGGLAITNDRAMGAMSLYDLNRLEIKKGNVLKGPEVYQGRFRMARLERIPESLAGQVNTLRMLLTAIRRMGRPVHVFRGLPTFQRAYFHFDAMPRTLSDLTGGNTLRLEQIPDALRRLGMAQKLLETNGLGHDVLKMYANRDTHFGACCLAFCHLRDRDEKANGLIPELYNEILTYMKGTNPMSEKDGALVRFGEAAAGIQKNPGRSSASDELLVFKLCLDTVNQARREGQNDQKSLVYAVAGELETNLTRRQKAAAKANRHNKSLADGCMAVAELFVNEVWHGVMKGKTPSQKSRRVLSSIYRVAFVKAHREITQAKKNENANPEDTE